MLLNLSLLCPGTTFFSVYISFVLDFGNGFFFCPAGSHSAKQPGFSNRKKSKEALILHSIPSIFLSLPVEPVNILQLCHLSRPLPHEVLLSPCSLLSLCFARAALSVQSHCEMLGWHALVSPPLLHFLTFILSSLHLALKKNNITKFPNVYSRVRNSSSSTPVVVDVSQTWQASLYYLPPSFIRSSHLGFDLPIPLFLLIIPPS